MNSQPFSSELFLLIVAIGAIVLFLYFVLFDRTDVYDVEIDNIYRRIEDNNKLSNQIDEELEKATLPHINPFDEKQSIHEEQFD